MLTNANITIYNKVENKESRMLEWYRTVLKNVHVFETTKAEQMNNAGRIANEASIRIPESCNQYRNYVPGTEYVGNGWTLNTGDLIVNGICTLDITGISTLEKNNVKPLRILSVNDNRRGLNPHLRVRCE